MKSLKSRIVVNLIIIVGFIIISCDKNDNNFNDDLLGKWILSSVESTTDNSIILYPDTLENKISITLTDSSIVLLDGYCNGGSGTYKVDGNNISFLDLQMSEFGCLLVGWEAYLFWLPNEGTYKINQDQLRIYAENNSILNFLKETI